MPVVSDPDTTLPMERPQKKKKKKSATIWWTEVSKRTKKGGKFVRIPGRAGNLLNSFLSESLVFCEKMSK